MDVDLLDGCEKAALIEPMLSTAVQRHVCVGDFPILLYVELSV